MTSQAAFHRGIRPILKLLVSGKEAAVLAAEPDSELMARIEELASSSTEGELTPAEREEYEGYVRANKLVALLRRLIKNHEQNSSS